MTTNDVTLNLIHLLVQQKIITAKQADALFQQAQQQAGAAAAPVAAPVGPGAASPPTIGSAPPPVPPGAPPTVRVTYVPEAVKQEIKEETKKELIAEGSLPPPPASVLPEWLRGFKFDGDFRFRYERVLYDGSNSNLFINYNALAQSSTPFDISSNQLSFPPLLDTTEDRTLVRVRARFGFTDALSNDVTLGMRLSTGSNGGPVSPNQTLGTSFSEWGVFFDRAYLDYHPLAWAQFRAGRFANPWFQTDLMWYSDLNFDGAAVELAGEATPTLRPFLTAGAFPVQNTAFDFPTFDDQKQASHDKWLYGAQVGLSWLPEKQFLVKLGAAYFDYVNLEGKASSPCLAYLVSIACDTDDTRPGFLQQGNTVYGIRNIVLPPSITTPSAFQYFGLATPFRDIDVSGRIDWAMWNPVHLILDGEFAMNLAFNKSAISSKNPVNNLDANGNFDGGNIAYMTKLTVGHPEIKHLGDWNVSGAYKYLESDSLVDAFTDPDFHFGGTNAKGYIIGTNLGIARDVWVTARYLSATEVSGPPYGVDVIQLDLNARF
ncbi:MAG TPA: putative porin [Stellaceae bacterium]|nr:putative porin [Stellaceae bacterium]